MTQATLDQTAIPPELQQFIDSGAVETKAVFNPQVQLTNKEGVPGAYLMGIYRGIREQKYEYGGESKVGHIATVTLGDTNVSVKRNNEGLFTEVKKADAIGRDVDLWVDGQLKYVLSSIAPGDRFGVLYTGKATVEGYLQPLHQFRFFRHTNAETVPF